MTQVVKTSGMHCAMCKARLEKVFLAEGIKADANFETGLVTVESENGIALETIKNLVEDLGFDFLGEA